MQIIYLLAINSYFSNFRIFLQFDQQLKLGQRFLQKGPRAILIRIEHPSRGSKKEENFAPFFAFTCHVGSLVKASFVPFSCPSQLFIRNFKYVETEL